MIVIVDYKTANLGSLVNIFKRIGVAARVARTPQELQGARRIVLPGIGHFDTCAGNLRREGFSSALNDLVFRDGGLPLLGICVGAQLLTRGSEEGTEPGLAWINASTRRFPALELDDYKVPHMGWNVVQPVRPHPLFDADAPSPPRFYFVHSYCMQCDETGDALARTVHGIEFDSAIARANVIGVQFHPEKSHRFGMELLRRFAAWEPGTPVAAC